MTAIGAELVEWNAGKSRAQLDLASDPDSTVVAWCERGSLAIEQAATIADARDIKDWADTIEHAAKVRDLNHETIILASALKIRAERRIGQLLGPASMGRPKESSPASELLDKDDRHRARQLAEPIDDEFEQAIEEAAEEAREKAGISRRSVLSKLDERKREADEQREWIESMGEDPDPEGTRLRTLAQRAVIGLDHGVTQLVNDISPEELAVALATYPERQMHVRDLIVTRIRRAAIEIQRYEEALR